MVGICSGLSNKKSMNDIEKWSTETLLGLGVDPDFVDALVSSDLESEDLIQATRFLSLLPRQNHVWMELMQTADKSQFGVQDWMKAIVTMSKYVAKNRISTTASVVYGFIRCASLSPEARLGKSLDSLVQAYLVDPGFENRKD